MRAKYVMSEVLVGLWRNVTMTMAMIITMSVSLFLLGASALLFLQVDKMKDFYYANIEVTVFLRSDVTQQQHDELDSQLRSDPLVKSVKFENQDDAYKRFKVMFADAPDLVSATKKEQLPEAFRLKLRDPAQVPAFIAKYKPAAGIDQIVDQRKLLEKIFKVTGAAQTGMLAIVAFMAVAALFLIGNTIQVAAYSKRREVAVMKLVGASNWFIQAPFVLEAVVAGLMGAIIAFLMLVGFKGLLIDGPLEVLNRVLTPLSWGHVYLMLPVLAGVASVISAVAAWVTLRFYLRV